MKETEDFLKKGLDQLEIRWTDLQFKAFSAYLSELKKWNRVHNLTGLKSDRDIIVKHFLDSLLFLKVLPEEVSTVADIGSGAGFPGIPVKIIAQELKMFLLEPSKKKVVFLKHICGKLGLEGVEVLDSRIEDVEGLRVDAAMTRALYSVGEFIEKAERILTANGVLILSKGPKLAEELEGLDLRNITVSDIELPFTGTTRHLVVVRR
ncbi:MAG: 16S rRNA (guanine(527)-N(7))-methyltransferase RsmG [Nitrospiraceae bacterium]|nr:16S rRNA (guanine(527)-N(7))-methyltransferase RsmG [Nitrospiraceae bacterium]